jgi:hypothetical protein
MDEISSVDEGAHGTRNRFRFSVTATTTTTKPFIPKQVGVG